MSIARPTSILPRRAAALLLALLLVLASAGPLVAFAGAQSLVDGPQTKEQAEQARQEAQQAADEGSGISTEAALGIIGVLVIGGAIAFMLRDSGAAVGSDRRAAPVRQPVSSGSTRGVPKGMFEGTDGKPGGQVGKAKKRAKGKRQRQARRASR